MKSRANFRLLDAKPCTQKASRRNPPPDWNSRQGTARVAKGQSRARAAEAARGEDRRAAGGAVAHEAGLRQVGDGEHLAGGDGPRTTPLRHGHPHGNSPPSPHTSPPAPTARPRRRHLCRAPRPQSRGPSPGSARPRPAGRRSAGARGHGVRRADPKMPRAAPAASPPGRRPSASPRPRATPRGPLLRIGRGRRAEDLPPSVGPPPRAAAPPRAPAPRAEAPGWPRGIGPGPRSCARRRAIGQGPG
mmetsp:Transcript_75956/g.246501  ORF Transcript_75956/g.246501 Transcript_75956/m.246501 type:complete len:246 (+) Transcript_75956:983-1720(+)